MHINMRLGVDFSNQRFMAKCLNPTTTFVLNSGLCCNDLYNKNFRNLISSKLLINLPQACIIAYLGLVTVKKNDSILHLVFKMTLKKVKEEKKNSFLNLTPIQSQKSILNL